MQGRFLTLLTASRTSQDPATFRVTNSRDRSCRDRCTSGLRPAQLTPARQFMTARRLVSGGLYPSRLDSVCSQLFFTDLGDGDVGAPRRVRPILHLGKRKWALEWHSDFLNSLGHWLCRHLLACGPAAVAVCQILQTDVVIAPPCVQQHRCCRFRPGIHTRSDHSRRFRRRVKLQRHNPIYVLMSGVELSSRVLDCLSIEPPCFLTTANPGMQRRKACDKRILRAIAAADPDARIGMQLRPRRT